MQIIKKMAMRLKKILVQIINHDQVGFLPKRYLRNNVRMIMDVLEYYETHSEKQLALIFLDAEKAFDNVIWNFLISQMEYMEVGDKFLKMIKAVYTQQVAKIRIDGELTREIQISKGTRQGCPLSLLLFIWTLEILNNRIWEDMKIRGLKIKKEEYMLQAFAYDLVFVLEEPLE